MDSIRSITVAVLALANGAGCQPRGTANPPELVVLASGDTAGWIVPCGCTSNQSGGLLRRGTLVEQVRGEAGVIYVDVGGAAAGQAPYDRAKFEAILAGELAMGLEAHNLGAPELALGLDYLGELGGRLKAPWLSCNVRDTRGKLAVAPARIVTDNGRRVALIGVVSDRQPFEGMQLDPPREAILKTLTDHRGQYDWVIVLAYLDQSELEELAANLPEADVVIGGPTGQSIAPKKVGGTLLVSATNKGKFIARLDAPPAGGRAWTGKVIEMGDSLADDSRQQTNLQQFYAKLAQRDFAAAETSFIQVAPGSTPRTYQVAGTERCRDCHEADCQTWEASGHARAWQSLTATGAQVDSYCQQCHTTGFGLPGGFVSSRRSEARAAVGCESCHGPSLAHAEDAKRKTALAGQTAGQCAHCHDRENSPKFGYDEYWPRIRHGREP